MLDLRIFIQLLFA